MRAASATALFLVLTMGKIQIVEAVTQEEAEEERREVRQEKWQELEASGTSSEESSDEDETAEEAALQRERAMGAQMLLEEKRGELEEAETGEEKEMLKKELKRLEKELLRFPKRDRLSFGADSDMTYDNNVFRNVIRSEEGDTLFKMAPFVEVDLGGRKTDIRAEYRWDRRYNAKVAEGRDVLNQDGTVRTGRKIGKKTTLSLNDRLGRSSTRVTSIEDGKQVRWDNSHRASLNYKLNRKLTLNFETDYTRSDFPHENFDQDANYQVQIDPNIFFQITPKTRITGGYRMTIARSKTEGSDNTQHQLRMGYTGKLTAKSSLSMDLTHTFQNPDSTQTGRSDLTTSSVGFIWLATPKTSLRLFYSNSFQHFISDNAAQDKITTRTASDTFSANIRFRLNRKINTEFSYDGAHSHTKTRQTGIDNVRTRTWVFPFQLSLDFQLTRWLRLRFSYTYRHQIGNEDTDQNRAHTWFFGSNLAV